jgi:hypothetical protein
MRDIHSSTIIWSGIEYAIRAYGVAILIACSVPSAGGFIGF